MLEKLTPRDRVALKVAGVSLLFFLVADFVALPVYEALETSSGGIEKKELTLRRYQRLVASAAAQPATRVAVEQRLRDAESGLLESPSETLADAEWQRLVSELAREKGLELTSSEVLRTENLSPDYALITGRVALAARLDQLVDLLVAMASSRKLLDTTSLKVRPLQGDPQKKLQVEIVVGAAMHAAKSAGGVVEKH